MRLFALGRVVATRNLLDTLPGMNVGPYIDRHLAGDWGDISEVDKLLNNDAIYSGTRILSAYVHDGVRFYIITEADRSSTTLLLPEDY